jgi:hypothetical protein
MDPTIMDVVSPLNKKEDLVVETRTRNIISNVILPVNVDILTVIILYLELVKNYPQIQINNNKPLVQPLMTVMVIQTIVYSPPMDLLTVVIVSLLNKKEDLVVETRTLSIRNNVILHVNVDTLTVTILYPVLVTNYPQTQINNNKPLV